MATVLNRVAQVVRDLETLNVIRKDDDVKFCFSEEGHYFVWIILARNREDNLTTIKKCFEREFQEKISKAKIRAKEKQKIINEFTCFISAD